jgi:hypothetical protein
MLSDDRPPLSPQMAEFLAELRFTVRQAIGQAMDQSQVEEIPPDVFMEMMFFVIFEISIDALKNNPGLTEASYERRLRDVMTSTMKLVSFWTYEQYLQHEGVRKCLN